MSDETRGVPLYKAGKVTFVMSGGDVPVFPTTHVAYDLAEARLLEAVAEACMAYRDDPTARYAATWDALLNAIGGLAAHRKEQAS